MSELKLHMIWFPTLERPPAPVKVREGYVLRAMELADRDAWLDLIATSGFFLHPETEAAVLFDEYWGAETSWLGVFHRQTGRLAAADFMHIGDYPMYPNGAQMLYISVRPADRGFGLARSLTRQHMIDAASAGLHNLFAETDDQRLPSIVNTFRLGFRPCLYAEEMAGRWEVVCQNSSLPFTPDQWPRSGHFAA